MCSIASEIDPCTDVHLCVNIKSDSAPYKGDNANDGDEEVEYYYLITIQNCSSLTLTCASVRVRLGSVVYTGNKGVSGAPAYSVTAEPCNMTTLRESWDGETDTLLFEPFILPPGSYQFWVRFRRIRPAGAVFLNSTLEFHAEVPDASVRCQFLCGIEKCLSIQGDCL